MPSSARCPGTIGGGSPLAPMADNMVRVPVAPGCITFNRVLSQQPRPRTRSQRH